MIYLGAPLDIVPDDEEDGYSDDAAIVGLAVAKLETHVRAYCEKHGYEVLPLDATGPAPTLAALARLDARRAAATLRAADERARDATWLMQHAPALREPP